LSTIIGSWGRDNLIKNKYKQIIKPNSQSNTILNDEIEENKFFKGEKTCQLG
jgi:hypothetical protein